MLVTSLDGSTFWSEDGDSVVGHSDPNEPFLVLSAEDRFLPHVLSAGKGTFCTVLRQGRLLMAVRRDLDCLQES